MKLFKPKHRSAHSVPYRCRQRVAEYDREQDTASGEFKEVLCHQISPTHFSFWTDTPPKSHFLTVELRSPEYSTDLIVEVKHKTPVKVDGDTKTLVRCMFVERRKA